jgi:hypothetical protein
MELIITFRSFCVKACKTVLSERKTEGDD